MEEFNNFKNKKKYSTCTKKTAPEWKKTGMIHKMAPEVFGISGNLVGKSIGVSRSVIKNFEEGKPVLRSKLVEKSYTLLLNFIYNKFIRHSKSSSHVFYDFQYVCEIAMPGIIPPTLIIEDALCRSQISLSTVKEVAEKNNWFTVEDKLKRRIIVIGSLDSGEVVTFEIPCSFM